MGSKTQVGLAAGKMEADDTEALVGILRSNNDGIRSRSTPIQRAKLSLE
jgi:hypothetical protein